MVGIGNANGVRTVAVLTQMDVPLGRSAGNGVEVAESVDVLAGRGPADVTELTLALAREMVALAGLDVDPAERLADGSALAAWRAMVEAQGGDPDAPLPEAPHVEVVRAPSSGYLTRLEARGLGVAAWRLGAGRARKEDPVSPSAGVVWHAGVGDAVAEGQPLLELRTEDPAKVPAALASLDGAWAVGPEPVAPPPLVIDRIA
jgi:thymidine phosphorylase